MDKKPIINQWVKQEIKDAADKVVSPRHLSSDLYCRCSKYTYEGKVKSSWLSLHETGTSGHWVGTRTATKNALQ